MKTSTFILVLIASVLTTLTQSLLVSAVAFSTVGYIVLKFSR